MENINSLRDEKTGRFQTTTDTTRYKMVQFNNRRMSDHARTFCMALNIPEIPKGFVIHHLDENKRNNDIHNLALITITAHNRLHAHEPWNKNVKAENNEQWANTVIKQRLAREQHYLVKFKEANDLYESGKTHQEIATLLGIGRQTVGLRIKRYKELTQKYE